MEYIYDFLTSLVKIYKTDILLKMRLGWKKRCRGWRSQRGRKKKISTRSRRTIVWIFGTAHQEIFFSLHRSQENSALNSNDRSWFTRSVHGTREDIVASQSTFAPKQLLFSRNVYEDVPYSLFASIIYEIQRIPNKMFAIVNYHATRVVNILIIIKQKIKIYS